jgi:hypothetical protein
MCKNCIKLIDKKFEKCENYNVSSPEYIFVLRILSYLFYINNIFTKKNYKD